MEQNRALNGESEQNRSRKTEILQHSALAKLLANKSAGPNFVSSFSKVFLILGFSVQARVDKNIIQQQSSSSSSNRFIEHDVSTRKLGPSLGNIILMYSWCKVWQAWMNGLHHCSTH